MWNVLFTRYFDSWLLEQSNELQECVLAALQNLEVYGPRLPRPHADNIKGSKYANMKELRIQYTGKPIRVFFAFDPTRQAVVLCAGYKTNNKKFYQTMIHIADREFTSYLLSIREDHENTSTSYR
ncbi:type II toxin-antitoxin system RelE/ParE family toxin [Proteus columbae]|uniref:type II toxin-antitoxin system RelE/ParE family toxin n=1 Tax=Proteus columbae TaxID=1987580 RepID=UPI0018C6E1E2|nr:type II toxin-antitoxin system RelE/ParE family toxin [Proteus columbae]MBG6027895.1 type II toxin-antitoxin system RelE/ParE family toxin [Proteus mirabilis]MBG6047311.1 type II toxin-antitoxin system RelE/ParE family toxin [Proteus mirabilis]